MTDHPHVLVVEDEKPLLRAIKDTLEKNNFRVSTARSVNEAKEILADEVVDLIWLDHYLLGRGTGLDFLAELKSADATIPIPIFVVSNTASESKIRSYLRLGVKKYYTKADHPLEEIINEMKVALDGEV